MQPQLLESRPPYFDFDARSIEKRKTIEEGGALYYEHVDFIIITPHGSKDRIERVWTEYEAYLRGLVKNNMYPPSWLKWFQDGHSEWKAGRDLPINGTPIRNWPVLTTGEVKALVNAKILTVEDLAAANEAMIQMLGMGGRALKQKAVDWITAKATDAPTVELISALRVQNEMLLTQVSGLKEQNALLQAQLSAYLRTAPPSRGPAAEDFIPSGTRGRQDDGEKDLDRGLDSAIAGFSPADKDDDL